MFAPTCDRTSTVPQPLKIRMASCAVLRDAQRFREASARSLTRVSAVGKVGFTVRLHASRLCCKSPSENNRWSKVYTKFTIRDSIH